MGPQPFWGGSLEDIQQVGDREEARVEAVAIGADQVGEVRRGQRSPVGGNQVEGQRQHVRSLQVAAEPPVLADVLFGERLAKAPGAAGEARRVVVAF